MGSAISGLMGGQTTATTTNNIAQTSPTQAGTGALGNSGFYSADQVNQQSNFVNALQGQLTQLANGNGPNPALSQLQNTTQANVGQANAALAANRNLNPALAAKMANQNQISSNQAAANAAATQTANQQIAAMQSASGLATQEQQIQNSANLGAQNINANVAMNNTQATNQVNMANTAAQNQVNLANAAAAQSATSGLVSGAGAAMGLAHGGMVPHYAFGTDDLGIGSVAPAGADTIATDTLSSSPADGPTSKVGKFLKGFGSASASKSGSATPASIPQMQQAHTSDLTGGYSGKAMAKGGKVSCVLSPGEKCLTPEQSRDVAADKKNIKDVGRKVPGKAKVKGDSLANDTVPATLEEGGMVIPRSAMKDAASATAFVKTHFMKRGK